MYFFSVSHGNPGNVLCEEKYTKPSTCMSDQHLSLYPALLLQNATCRLMCVSDVPQRSLSAPQPAFSLEDNCWCSKSPLFCAQAFVEWQSHSCGWDLGHKMVISYWCSEEPMWFGVSVFLPLEVLLKAVWAVTGMAGNDIVKTTGWVGCWRSRGLVFGALSDNQQQSTVDKNKPH